MKTLYLKSSRLGEVKILWELNKHYAKGKTSKLTKQNDYEISSKEEDTNTFSIRTRKVKNGTGNSKKGVFCPTLRKGQKIQWTVLPF